MGARSGKGEVAYISVTVSSSIGCKAKPWMTYANNQGLLQTETSQAALGRMRQLSWQATPVRK